MWQTWGITGVVLAIAVGYVQVELNQPSFDFDVAAAEAAFPTDVIAQHAPETLLEDGEIVFGRWKEPVDFPAMEIDGFGQWLRSYTRLKRWHFISVSTDKYFLALAIANLNYVSNVFVYLVDKEGKQPTLEYNAIVPTASGIYGSNSPTTECTVSSGRFSICPTEHKGFAVKGFVFLSHDASPREQRLEMDFEVAEREVLALSFPLPTPSPAYVQKSAGAVARGSVRLDGGDPHSFTDAVAVSDYTISWAERETRWKWASCAAVALVTSTEADGTVTEGRHRVGFHFSTDVYDIDGASMENVAFIRDRVFPMPAVTFDVPQNTVSADWRVDAGARVDLRFSPQGAREEHRDYGTLVSDFVQPFGKWSGTFVVEDGDTTHKVTLEPSYGVAERHYARW